MAYKASVQKAAKSVRREARKHMSPKPCACSYIKAGQGQPRPAKAGAIKAITDYNPKPPHTRLSANHHKKLRGKLL